MRNKILVTGVGGNVGQGILRNLRNLNYDLYLIGTNTEHVSGGNHLCDKVSKVPFSQSSDYIPKILSICKREKIDLIIPSTDYEMYYLALSATNLPTIAGSNSLVAKTFLNKYETWKSFKKCGIPFAKTTIPSLYNNDFNEIIIKPVEGRGSRDIFINPVKPKSYSDDFIIQKLYKGREITTAFYVTKKKKLLGSITFLRLLYNGATYICEVTFDYNKKIQSIIEKVINNFDIAGSCNIQSIVDENENIWPFELNCRISGTNSIRGQFGFEDVKYTVEEYLFNITPKKPVIKKGSAVRILMDIIYPNVNLDGIRDKNTKHYIY